MPHHHRRRRQAKPLAILRPKLLTKFIRPLRPLRHKLAHKPIDRPLRQRHRIRHRRTRNDITLPRQQRPPQLPQDPPPHRHIPRRPLREIPRTIRQHPPLKRPKKRPLPPLQPLPAQTRHLRIPQPAPTHQRIHRPHPTILRRARATQHLRRRIHRRQPLPPDQLIAPHPQLPRRRLRPHQAQLRQVRQDQARLGIPPPRLIGKDRPDLPPGRSPTLRRARPSPQVTLQLLRRQPSHRHRIRIRARKRPHPLPQRRSIIAPRHRRRPLQPHRQQIAHRRKPRSLHRPASLAIMT